MTDKIGRQHLRRQQIFISTLMVGFLWTCLFVKSQLSAQTVFVPTSHWIYEYIDRMESQRILPVALNGTKPITRHEIARYLEQIIKYQSDGGQMSRTQTEQLEFLRFEFMEELEKSDTDKKGEEFYKLIKHRWIDPWLPDFIYANRRNFLSISSGPLHFYWDPIFRRERAFAWADTLHSRERVFQNTNGFVMWGTVGEGLGFFADVRDTHEWGTRRYPGIVNYTREGLGFVRGSGDGEDHDETVAYLTYHWRYLTLQFGKDVNKWGPGDRGQLALSDRATSYDLFKVQISHRRFKFTSMTAWLQHFNDEFFLGNHQEKAMAAHRLEFAPIEQLDIGVHETVIYAGRKFEPAYLNPVMFFRSAEHYLGDRDNAAMGLDIELKAIRNIKIYGEFFIDDIKTSKLGTGFYGNKFAYLTGLYFVDLFKIPDLDLRAEYARIRPYTYSHHGLTGYWHYATGLGHWLGPNADGLFVEATYRTSRKLFFKTFWQQRRHGANSPDTNNGGDIFRWHALPGDPLYVELLTGVREQITTLSVLGNYEILRNGFIQLMFQYHSGESQWADDYPGNRSEFVLKMSLNY